MNDCLVTKLKGTVDNDNLETIGSFSVYFLKGNNGSFNISPNVGTGNSINLKVRGNGYFSDSTYQQNLGKEITFVQGTGEAAICFVYVVPTDDCRVEITGIPYGTRIGQLQIDDNCYCELTRIYKYWNISTFNNNDGYGSICSLYSTLDLNEIAHPEYAPRLILKDINQVIGSIDIFENLSTLIILEVWGNNEVTGDLSSLSSATSMTRFNVGGHISGALESLLQAWASAGVVRNLQCTIAGSDRATFGGKRMRNVGGRTGDDIAFAVITSSSDIKVYNNNASGLLLGSYNGTSWTYSNGYEADN